MNRKEVAAVLDEIALLLELSGENPFKARSYANVARQIVQTDADIAELVKANRLCELKGVGEELEQKITELVTTGRLKYYEDLRAKFPDSLFDLFRIPGLGAKRIKTLYDDLDIKTLGELEYACTENRLITLKGFGPRMQQKVLDGLSFAKRHQGLYLVNTALEAARALREHLLEAKSISNIASQKSRRRKEVVRHRSPASDIIRRYHGALVEAPVRVRHQFAARPKSACARGRHPVDLASFGRTVPYALAHFTAVRT